MLKKNEPDWIEHDGSSECPVPAGHDVEVEYNWGKTYRCDNPKLRDWTRTTHYRDWTAFEQQQASAGDAPPLVRAREEYAKCLRSEIAPLTMSGEPSYSQADIWERAFARYIAAHEPKGEVPKLLTEAEWRELLARHTFRDFIPGLIADLRERGLIAPEPEPDALRDLAEELARESQDLNLPLRKRVDWFEAQLRERGLIAPEPEPDALREVVNDAWSNTISRLAFGEFKVSEAIGTMISGVNFDAMRDALTAELRARGVTAPARGEG